MMATNATTRAVTDGRAESGRSLTGRDTKASVRCGVVRTVVVLPTYNEAENIEDVLRRARTAVPSAGILVVDDSSPDGTAKIVEELADEIGDVQVLRRPAKAGLGSAYRFGFAAAMDEGADVLVEMDSDLSHDPADLPALLAAVEHGADLAIGSRYVPGGRIPNWSWRRKMLSRWGNRYAAGMLGLAVNDATAGFRAYRATALERIDLSRIRADGYGFQIEMTYRLVQRGGRVVEVPIAFVDRRRGSSKMSSRIVLEALALVTWWSVRDRLLARR
jgi:dolichol-phosphate mannosyltransferase